MLFFSFLSCNSLSCCLNSQVSPNPTNQICTSLEDVQDEIVNVHNAFRRAVVPTASNMLKMNWSEEVATSAQDWANTCAMAHGPPSSRMLGSYQMGENLFKSSELLPWTDVVTAWHNEVANYNYPTGSANGKEIGHYTQVIWFSSYEVGCGVAKCGNDYFYDCQYYRAGNYRRVPPYSLGEPCSACPQACDNKLCTNPCPYVNTFANCPALKKQGPCSDYLQKWCSAQCFCTTEIIPTN
ncbi:cysteine-rich venom protein pseudechetoxin [Ictalurus furcatus]|uniref:cysteine-rich venom protein pseudechetoxin n=1 Tax=Ictalurus furcatus TaxID=66913 RepID=UPI002350BEB2|nr:cysteine-rich venom protein pseudechetoxin [Ictalurus furcatus]